MRAAWLIVLAVSTLPFVLAAPARGAASGKTTPDVVPRLHVAPSLIAETDGLVAGRTEWLGVRFKIDPSWHIYWNGQNDTGYAPEFAPDLPEGFAVGPPLWPAPERHVSPGNILDHVYSGEVTLLFPLEVPANATPGDVVIVGKLEWLVCRDVCIPEETTLSLTTSIVAAGELPRRSADAVHIERSRGRIPRPLERNANVRTRWRGDVLTIEAKGAGELAFYPGLHGRALVDPISDGARQGSKLPLRFKGGEATDRVTGVLEIRWKDGRAPSLYQIDLPGRG